MRRTIFDQLAENIEPLLKTKFKYRDLKKDPLQIGRADLYRGSFYLEYVPNCLHPYGAFMTILLDGHGMYKLPQSPYKDYDSLWIDFGFHDTPEDLAQYISDHLNIIRTCFENNLNA